MILKDSLVSLDYKPSKDNIIYLLYAYEIYNCYNSLILQYNDTSLNNSILLIIHFQRTKQIIY